jgi:hypothetical protein
MRSTLKAILKRHARLEAICICELLAMRPTVVVMFAANGARGQKRAVQVALSNFLSRALGADDYFYVFLVEKVDSAATHATADDHIDASLRKKKRQEAGAVTRTCDRLDFDDFLVPRMEDDKCLTMTEVLGHLSIITCYGDFYHVVTSLSMVCPSLHENRAFFYYDCRTVGAICQTQSNKSAIVFLKISFTAVPEGHSTSTIVFALLTALTAAGSNGILPTKGNPRSLQNCSIFSEIPEFISCLFVHTAIFVIHMPLLQQVILPLMRLLPFPIPQGVLFLAGLVLTRIISGWIIKVSVRYVPQLFGIFPSEQRMLRDSGGGAKM